MSSADFAREWAWLIAIGLSVGLVGLLLAIRRMQAHHARKRALAVAAGDEAATDTHAGFLRARRNFLILLVIVIVFFVTVEVWNLYYLLER
jgi:type VI protein secretion system component VasK